MQNEYVNNILKDKYITAIRPKKLFGLIALVSS
jgi:hypothetical protein